MSEESRRMVTALEMTGNFRVLARFQPHKHFVAFEGVKERAGAKLAMFLECKTIGANPAQGKVLELGYVMAWFNAKTGVVYEVESEYAGFEDPGFALPGKFKTVGGMEDGDVEGKAFDEGRIAADLERAVIVVSHEGSAARPMLEKRFPGLAAKWFMCSTREIDWRSHGLQAKQLDYVAFSLCGVYYTVRRSLFEAQVLAEIVSRSSADGVPILKGLMDRSKRVAWRVWAKDSPLEAKVLLEARGYKWSDGSDPLRPIEAWWRATEALDEELEFLSTKVYDSEVTIPVEKVTGRERYSGRRGDVQGVKITPSKGAADEPKVGAGQGAAARAPAAPQQGSPARSTAAPAAGSDRQQATQAGGAQRARQPAQEPAQSFASDDFPI